MPITAGAAPAVISDINDSAVKVQTGLSTKPADILAEVSRGCGIYGKASVEISFKSVDQYCFSKEVLFACKYRAPRKRVRGTVPDNPCVTTVP